MAGGRRIAVLGAGSVGCFIGGAWAAAGLPVTLIGRRKIAQAVDEHGLTLSYYTGWMANHPPVTSTIAVGPRHSTRSRSSR